MANYKSFFVKKFHASLVAQARNLFNDARSKSERWVQSVTLPLETQMKDHKTAAAARAWTTSRRSTRSPPASTSSWPSLRAAGDALQKQREMIDGLLQRVSRDEAAAAAAPAPAAERTTPVTPPELMETTRLSVFEAPLTITRRAARAQEVFREVAHVKEEAPKPVARKPAAPAKPAEAPMISDDLLSALAGRDPDSTLDQRGSDGEKTQRLPAFDPRLYKPDGTKIAPGQPAGADQTQKMYPEEAVRTQRLEPAQTQGLQEKLDKLREIRRKLQEATPKT